LFIKGTINLQAAAEDVVGFDTFFYPSHRNTVKNDDSIFLLNIADCDSGTASIPESGAVAGAVAKAWRHFP